MNTMYCQFCGGATQYTLNKPNFCAKCGRSFTSIAAQAPPTPVITSVPINQYRKIEIDDDDSPVEAEIPNINKLDLQVQVGTYKEKMGNVMGTEKLGVERPIIKGKRGRQKSARKTILEECQSARNKPINEIE